MKKESAVKTVAKKAADAKVAAEKAVPEVKATVAKTTAAAKKTAEKAAPEVKAAVTKTTAAAKKTAAKVESEVKTAAKKAAPKKAAKTSVTVMLQYAGKEFSYDELVARARGAWQGDAMKELALYVKPEEDRVYMVVNGEAAGSFEL